VLTHKIQDLKLMFETCCCIQLQPKACRYIKSVYLSVEIFGKQKTSGTIVIDHHTDHQQQYRIFGSVKVERSPEDRATALALEVVRESSCRACSALALA
jgi:CobQ-like glutamine amidotransferase family enzyme